MTAHGNSRLSAKAKQEIILGFLRATGSEEFSPSEFLAWLEPQTDHIAWSIFFGLSDVEAAHEYRLDLVRKFVQPLRLRISGESVEVVHASTCVKLVAEPAVEIYPYMISDRAGRLTGGGYHITQDGDRPAITAPSFRENCGQAADDLNRWLERYGTVALKVGIDLTPFFAAERALREG